MKAFDDEQMARATRNLETPVAGRHVGPVVEVAPPPTVAVLLRELRLNVQAKCGAYTLPSAMSGCVDK